MADLRQLEERTYKTLLAREAKYAAEMQTVLRDALDEMRLAMAKIYEKYAKDGILTRAEMTQYNRMATLEKQMLNVIKPATQKTLRVIERLRPEQYEAAFFHYAWAIDNAAGVRIAWGLLNRDAILENLVNEFYFISKTRYTGNVQLATRTALNKGLALGKSYPQMAKDLKDVINASNYEALRILRTEGQSAINAGQDDCYTRAQEKGIEGGTIWDATLDDRTRPDHQAADGQQRDKDGMFTIGGEKTPYPAWEGLSAEQRINCRCRARFEIEDYSPQLRRTRDEGVIQYQVYEQWDRGRKHLL